MAVQQDHQDVAAAFRPDLGMSFDELHDVLRRSREELPVFHWAPLDMWVVTRHDDVLAALRDADRFSNHDILSFVPVAPEVEAHLEAAGVPTHHNTPSWIGLLDGEEHRRQRATVSRSFTPRRINQLEPVAQQIADGLLDALDPGSPVEIVSAFAYPLPIMVILAFLDIPAADMPQLRAWSDDLTRLMSKPLGPPEQLALAESVISFDRYVTELMRSRRAAPGDDFLSALVADHDNWSDRDIRYFLMHGLILAGHETTKATIANGLSHLLEDRGRWQALVADPGLIPGVVEEILRYDPPLVGYFRRTRADVELHGAVIPAGSRVYLAYASANHDERRYACPAEFRTERPGPEAFHLSFSNGAHYCLGAPFARMELRVALSVLTTRFKDLRLAPTWAPYYEPNPLTRHLRDLVVELAPPG